MYSLIMDMQALTNPFFLAIVVIVAAAWKAGSLFDRWHKEHEQEQHRSDSARRIA
jgi:hypothetical protein